MKISRRSFIAQTTAAALAPLILPACATPKKASQNSMVNMGFIGMGIQNRGLLEAFLHHKNVRVVAVCDVDTTRRTAAQERVKEHYKGEVDCKAYADFRELIARKDIDAVSIATPDHWHAIPTLAALESGKDVYCEKPLTHTIHEAVLVMDAAKKHKRILQTGSMQRSMEEFKVACELVRNGLIGKVERVTCCVGNPGKPCDLPEEPMEPGLDWNFWLGPAPNRPYSSVLSPRGVHKHFPDWRSYLEYGGGGVCDFGAHHFDIAQWGLDMDESGPVDVRPPSDPAALHGAVWTYDNGIPVTHVNDGFNTHFYGSDGEARVSRGQFEFWLKGKKIAGWAKREDGGSLGSALKQVKEQYLADAKVKLYVSRDHPSNFLDCVASRKQPITNAETGGRSAIVCHLVNQCYYNRATLKWDPKKLHFVEGGGKPEWMTYNYRSPWKV
jgi:predicted dehydrogenase